MKQFLVLVFMVQSLADAHLWNVHEDEGIKKLLEEGYHINHISAPSIVKDETKGKDYIVSVSVELDKEKSAQEVLKDYIHQFTPVLQHYVQGAFGVPDTDPIPFRDIDGLHTNDIAPQYMHPSQYKELLKEKLLPELKEIAKELEIPKYKGYKKDELIDQIIMQYAEEHFPTDGEEVKPTPKKEPQNPVNSSHHSGSDAEKSKKAEAPTPKQEPKLSKAAQKRKARKEKREAAEAARKAKEEQDKK